MSHTIFPAVSGRLTPLLLLGLLPALASCGDDATATGDIRFACENISPPAAAGSVQIEVVWTNARGHLAAADPDFVTDIFPVYLGSAETQGSAWATVTYTANTDVQPRTTSLTVTDTDSGVTAAITLTQEGMEMPLLTIDAGRRCQTITGFGGMYLPEWANGGANFELTDSDIDRLFSSDGLGLNMLRVRISPDRNDWPRIVRAVKRARMHGATVLASPWSPPAAFKSNGSTVGGYLLPEHYADYAAHLKAFADYMASQGAGIDVVSIQNEPDYQVTYESCDWSPAQMTDFVRGHARDIGDVRIAAAESFQFRRPITDALLADPGASACFDIVAGHIYGGGIAPYPAARDAGKEVWMTEYNDASQFTGSFADAMRFAGTVHACMEADFNAFVWWYLKRYYGMLGDGTQQTVDGAVLKRGYVLAHYARYLQGGFRRIGIDSSADGLQATAYVDGSGKQYRAVIVNDGPTDFSPVRIALPATVLQATAVRTSAHEDLAPADVASDGDEVHLALPAASVTTLLIECR